LGVAVMVLPFLGAIGVPGSIIFPPPAFPNNVLLWSFVAYMAAGLGWLLLQTTLRPNTISVMKSAIEAVDQRFADGRGVSGTPVRPGRTGT